LYGEGQGIVISNEGDLATWIGQGVGTIKKDGAVSYRGAVYYQSSSARWSRLNSVAAIFEYEVDAQGNTRSQFWEWK
jgi:predicted methyltransferase